MLRRFLSCTRGAAAAEMALIVPLAVLILFTTLEAGHYFYQRHQVVKGLRDGARFAARQNFDDVHCRSGGFIDSTLVTTIKHLTRTGKVANGTPRIAQWVDGDITVTVTCPTSAESQTGIFATSEPAPQVNIATTFKYDSLFGGLGVFTDNVDLGGAQQATVMGI